jgi:hypothetical protein
MKPDVTPHWISLNVRKKKNTTKHLILIRLQGGKLIFRFSFQIKVDILTKKKRQSANLAFRWFGLGLVYGI